VLASAGNINENGHVGLSLPTRPPPLKLFFVDFFKDIIGLHVNGRAKIVEDELMRARDPQLPADPVPGRRPERWVTVHVEEAYIHCGKHIPKLIKLPEGRVWGGDFSAASTSSASVQGRH
jgi:hypothetical protein